MRGVLLVSRAATSVELGSASLAPFGSRYLAGGSACSVEGLDEACGLSTISFRLDVTSGIFGVAILGD